MVRIGAETFEELVMKRGIGVSLRPFIKIPGAVRSLEPGLRWVAAASLLLLGLLIAATWALGSEHRWFSAITWEDGGQTAALPRPALYLSLLGLAFSAAAILAGASRWSLWALAAAGPVESLSVVFTAFPGGKHSWLAAPSWLLPIFAAMSPVADRAPRTRLMMTVLFSALAAWHTHLFTPLSANGRPPNWPQLLGLFAVGALFLSLLRWRLTTTGGFLLAFLVSAGVLLLALRSGETAMARGLVIPASFFVGLYSVLWFVLGGGLVRGGVASASFAIKIASSGRAQVVAVLLCVVWLGEICLGPWLERRASPDGAQALWIHQWLTAVLLAIGITLLAMRRFTPRWTRGLLAVWVFSYAVLRAYFAGAFSVAGFRDRPTAGALVLAMFTLGIAMQVVKLLIDLPEARERRPGAPARLLFQLGALAFLATGTQFQFAIGDIEAMREAAAYQFAGASSLFLPVLLALLVTEQRWLVAPSRKHLVRAFLIGFAASFPVQLLRIASYHPAGFSLSAHLGAAAFGDALKLGSIAAVILISRAFTRMESAALAGACALGFGVGYELDLTVVALDAAVKVALLLTYQSPAVSEAFSALVGKYVEVRSALPAADHYFLVVASLLPAAMLGWAIARGARERRWGVSVAAMITALALSLTLAWAFQVHPLFETLGSRPIPFYEVVADPGALALVLASVLGLVAWLYLMVWRPERRASIGDRSAEIAAGGTIARPRNLAGMASVAAVALAAAGIGLGMSFAAPPPPLREYRDPEGRFAIDVPGLWRVRTIQGGETRFFAGDPLDGPMAMVIPAIALPPGSSSAQLIHGLESQLRTLCQDVEVVPQESPPRAEGGRSIQEIELAVTGSRPGKGRFRGRIALTLISEPGSTRFSYVSYQVPESEPASLDALLERVIRSYRPGSAR